MFCVMEVRTYSVCTYVTTPSEVDWNKTMLLPRIFYSHVTYYAMKIHSLRINPPAWV